MEKRIRLAPYMHCSETVNMLRMDLLVTLLPLVLISTVQNGLRVLVISFLSAFFAWITETIGELVKGKRRVAELRAATLGLVTALLCPVTVPIWLPVSAVVVSVLFVRVLLSKNFKTLFMTPAIGWLFMLSVAPKQMMSYPATIGFKAFPVFDHVANTKTAYSVAQYLQFGDKPPYKMLDILTGQYPGGMGTTCILAILAAGAYFLYRRAIAWHVSLSMIGTVAIFALIFDRTGAGWIHSVVYELAASSFLYVAVFIAGDLINAPMLPLSKIIFGVLLGVMSMILRYFGLPEHGVVFSLVIVNLISEPLDRFALRFRLRSALKSKT